MEIEQGTDLFERLCFGPEEFSPVAALKNSDGVADKMGKQQMPIVAYPRETGLNFSIVRLIAIKSKSSRSKVVVKNRKPHRTGTRRRTRRGV